MMYRSDCQVLNYVSGLDRIEVIGFFPFFEQGRGCELADIVSLVLALKLLASDEEASLSCEWLLLALRF